MNLLFFGVKAVLRENKTRFFDKGTLLKVVKFTFYSHGFCLPDHDCTWEGLVNLSYTYL